MKAALSSLVCLLAMAGARAQPPVVIYRPAAPSTVISPLTTPTSQSGQALLSQINATISERRFEHQVLTLQTTPVTQAAYLSTNSRASRAR